MKTEISNEQVVERVMRMGMEHRTGVPFERLHDLARKQLAEEAAREKQSLKYRSFEEWLADVTTCRFAFMFIKDRLQVIRVNNTETIRFIEWRTDTIPLIEHIA